MVNRTLRQPYPISKKNQNHLFANVKCSVPARNAGGSPDRIDNLTGRELGHGKVNCQGFD